MHYSMVHMGASHLFIIFAMVFLPLARAQCNGSTEVITKKNGEIKSPNFEHGGEYNKSANCIWSFNIPVGKEYVLVLTVTQLKLYVVKEKKNCLGSYNLTINHDQTKCDRYVHDLASGPTPAPANYFCKAYYSSPTCASATQIQVCETKQQTNFSVPVKYVSDGRTDPTATSTNMYFRIEHKFIDCEQEPPTTTPAPTTTTTDKTTVQEVPATSSSTSGDKSTKPSSPPGSNTTIIIAASAGGGLILILVTVLIICICKRRQKTGESTQEIPLQHQNGGTKETKIDQLAPVEGNSNPTYQAEATGYETVDRAGQSGSNDQQIEPVQYSAMGGVTQTDQSGAEMYTTVDLAHKNNQSGGGMYDTLGVVPGPTHPDSGLYDKLGGATATGQSGAVTYDKLGGVGLTDQSGVEMYSTVGGAPETDQSGGDTYDRLGGVIQANQSEPEMYSTVDTPPSVTQSSQPPSGHVTISDQPENAMYAAVSIKKKGVKETIHYNIESVDNVLYGTADDAK